MQSRVARFLLVAVAAVALVLSACGGSGREADVAAGQGNEQLSDATQVAQNATPQIADIVVTQVYWDFQDNQPRRQFKFVVMFDGMYGVDSTRAIKSMYAEGPNNYRFEIKNQPYDVSGGNGYIVESSWGNLIWYMAFDKTGFLPDGEYTITAEFTNGAKSQMSRVLRYDDSLLSSYLANKDRLVFSPTAWGVPPAEPVAVSDPQNVVEARWTTLDTFGGPDAYYCIRVSEDTGGGWGSGDLALFDNIFGQSASVPAAGLNKSSISLSTTSPLKPDAKYMWFVEICDSNRFRDINVCIFQPMQLFLTK
jgi:hypothetical protein